MRRSVDPKTDGLIYYVLDATRSEQRVKIGYTASLKQRLGALTLQTMSRQTPIVLALEEGGTLLETQRHEQFKHLWLIGEWHRFGADLDAFLADFPNPIGWLSDHPRLWLYADGWQSFNGWAVSANEDAVDEAAHILTIQQALLPASVSF